MTRNKAIDIVNKTIEAIEYLELDTVKKFKGYSDANYYANKAIDVLNKLAEALTQCPEWPEKYN